MAVVLVAAVLALVVLGPGLMRSDPTERPRWEPGGIFNTLNHNSIEFYGKVVDQYGEAVDGASVKASVMVSTGIRSGWRTATTVTAEDEGFDFTGLEGQDVSFVVSKEGYLFAQREGIYSYTYFEADHKRHIPDAAAPVEFILWRLQGPERMIHYNRISWDFTCDGKPVGINLRTARVDGEDPDIIVTVERSPQIQPPGGRDFYWRATIAAVDGGLQLAGERDYYNLAPEDGYAPEYVHVQTATDERPMDQRQQRWHWKRSHDAKLFFKIRDGYGVISFRIFAALDRKEGDNAAAIDATVWLNPGGSRNLEFDPSISRTITRWGGVIDNGPGWSD